MEGLTRFGALNRQVSQRERVESGGCAGRGIATMNSGPWLGEEWADVLFVEAEEL